MGSLIFPCPTNWRVIESGIETDQATLYRMRSCSVRLACPHCKLTHDLKVADGVLFEMRPRQSAVHYTGLLCDEIDVGAFIQRALPDARRPAGNPGAHSPFSHARRSR